MTTAPWLFLWRLDIILTSAPFCQSYIVQSNYKSQILIPFVQSFAIVLLLYSLLYSFCIPFLQVFQFDFNPIQSYFLNPIVFLLLSNSLYIKLSQVFNPLIIIFFFSKILRCSIGLALVMVTGGWKASNIFSLSPSLLFVFLLLDGDHHNSMFNFFHVIVLFWWK